jgi:GT2 family glycosyltransferase
MEQNRVGVIVIGRNEGDRLKDCFNSITGLKTVYVDSQSSDNSLSIALEMGIPSISIKPGEALTAANARNIGTKKLLETSPDIEFIQFVDGDSRLYPQWMEKGVEMLKQESDLGIVFGMITEYGANDSIYQRISHLEWRKEQGENKCCGGIFMVKKNVFNAVDGFNPLIIAAEDDELCLRVRKKGWKILHIHQFMAIHKNALNSFSQWWKRSTRSGYAYAQVYSLHRNSQESWFFREMFSTVFWGFVIPFMAIAFAYPTSGLSFLLLLGYPILFLKILKYTHMKRRWSLGDSILYALFCIFVKFPNFYGLVKYYIDHLKNRQPQIIEYK